MKTQLISLFLLFFLPTVSVESQINQVPTVVSIIERLKQTLVEYDTCHYTAEMRFREMGGDTFTVRNFSVSLRGNPANKLYGYDWLVGEKLQDGFMYTTMITSDMLYVIYEGNKGIGYRQLPVVLEVGGYPETMRNFFVLGEVLAPFIDVDPSLWTVVDSNNFIYVRKLKQERSSWEIILDKETFLPRQVTKTIYHRDLGLSQVHVFNYYFDKDCKVHDPQLSIDHYLSSGYTMRVPEIDQGVADFPSKTLTQEKINQLIAYPFLTTKGDTTFISSYKSNYILLDFWYASCLPCLNEMPVINQLGELYADKGLQVLGVNCFDKGISHNLESKFREKDISMPLFFGERTIVQLLGINSFPTYCLLMPDGNVQLIAGGVDEVKEIIESLFRD